MKNTVAQAYAKVVLAEIYFVIVQVLHNFKINAMEMHLKNLHLKSSQVHGDK